MTESERARAIEAHRRLHEAKVRRRRIARENATDRRKQRGWNAFIARLKEGKQQC
jgi:hypothetical protein